MSEQAQGREPGKRRTGDNAFDGAFRDDPSSPPAAVIAQARRGDAGPPLLVLLAAAFLAGFGAVWARERRA